MKLISAVAHTTRFHLHMTECEIRRICCTDAGYQKDGYAYSTLTPVNQFVHISLMRKMRVIMW